MIGHVFAQRYQLEEFIGKGGMALVFRAKDMRTEHDVAVKILRPEFSGDQEFIQRFRREALAASKMSHHNIVNLLDVGEEDGYHYLVLEYMHGRTLKAVIAEKGKLPESVVSQIAIRILSALQHAHSNGIIHRDIKPANILVNAEGHIKVADFGIARVAGSNTLSKNDSVMGSAHYFSPEQARGDDVSFASDVYSVGVVMYEMLTGKVPFDGDTPVAIALQHISSLPQPLRTVNEQVSPAMERVVLAALNKDPNNRYHSAADMARAIRAALNHPDIPDTGLGYTQTTDMRTQTNTATNTNTNAGVRTNAAAARRKKKKRMGNIAIVLLLTVLILGGLAWGTVRIVSDIVNATTAPFLLGETEKEAIRIGRESGLIVEVVRQSDDKVPAGHVILQSREYQYEMKRGDVIVITVSTGPKEQGVPQLTGYSLEEARIEAEKYGFNLLVTQYADSEKPLNTVIEQTPAKGEMLAYGEIVQVVISGSVTVPPFVGLTRSQAITLADQTGLISLQFVEYPTADEMQYERIADQQPKSGERVMYNEKITLLVYVPKPANTAAPAATQQPQEGQAQ
ncbi:MAG: Stk1 family PASTA domain-containing Ser/Thr kinase [Clostridia bacterium]|nr:Stk1 family PASTA domain-containing Ser/Thr kinase [Clostridia bacterium]